MIKSMTGFGKASRQLNSKTLVAEIRSLNSKTLDVSLKIPLAYKPFEPEIRNILAQTLVRGKLELIINLENGQSATISGLNRDVLEAYYRDVESFAAERGIPVGFDLLTALLRLPEVYSQTATEANDDEWQALRSAIEEAVALTDTFRISEGAHLEQDRVLRIQEIKNIMEAIRPLEKARKEAIKTKLIKSLGELESQVHPDPNRFEQELIYYLEKLDISEEIVRLEKHLAYFSDTLTETEAPGKKLGFICQEIGREINTIGSKANDAAIQQLVVQMKDELEKVKEQLMNIL